MQTCSNAAIATIAFCQTIAVSALLAQSGPYQAVPESYRPRLVSLLRSNARLLISMALDRDEYFPSEEALITITATNPTPERLEAVDPLTWDVAAFELH